MCEWYRREFGCRHYLIGAAAWCPDYSRTGRRCGIHIVYADYTSNDCTGCRNRRTEPTVAWEYMIDRSRCGWPDNRLTGKVVG